MQSQFEVAELAHNPGSNWGTLKIKIRLTNQRDEIVLEGWHLYRIRRRATPAHL